jgi:hypothetical protein
VIHPDGLQFAGLPFPVPAPYATADVELYLFQQVHPMTMLTINRVRFTTAMLLLVSAGCNRVAEDLPDSKRLFEKEPPAALLALGYVPEQIVAVEDGYLVDGDMLYTHDQIQELQSKHFIYGLASLVSYTNQANIRVWNDGLNSTWSSGLSQALSEWNSVTNCRINFVAGTSTSYDIRVYVRTPWPTIFGATCAVSPGPTSGIPGPVVQVNPAYVPQLSADAVKLLMVHELGHTIGFAHTDAPTPNSVFIEGTADAQPASVMHSANCTISYTSNPITTFDHLAFSLIYPDQLPVSNTKPLYRYWNATSIDHFYTMNWTEQAGNIFGNSYGFAYEGIACYLPTAQFAGTLPFYRYRHNTSNRHYYTTATVGSPYVLEGVEGYIYSAQVPVSIPLLRYRQALQTGGPHYVYTVSSFNTTGTGFTYDGIAGYVYPPPFL